jgi:hypothetical protein
MRLLSQSIGISSLTLMVKMQKSKKLFPIARVPIAYCLPSSVNLDAPELIILIISYITLAREKH